MRTKAVMLQPLALRQHRPSGNISDRQALSGALAASNWRRDGAQGVGEYQVLAAAPAVASVTSSGFDVFLRQLRLPPQKATDISRVVSIAATGCGKSSAGHNRARCQQLVLDELLAYLQARGLAGTAEHTGEVKLAFKVSAWANRAACLRFAGGVLDGGVQPDGS